MDVFFEWIWWCDDDLLEKYTIWHKVSPDIKKEFDCELVCKKEFLKTKLKSHGHGDKVADFHNKKIP